MPLLLPLLAALLPLLILPRSFFYFDITPKLVLLLVATAVLAVSPRSSELIAKLWRARGGRQLIALILCQMAALAVSTIVSGNQLLSLDGGNWRRFGLLTQCSLLTFVVLIASRVAADRMQIRLILRAVAVSGTLIACYACVQYFGWDPLLPSAAYHIGEGVWTIVRPPGTAGHADYLATYLLFAIFLGGSLVAIEPSRLWKGAGVLAAICGVVAIVLSGTRSALLGLLAGVLFLLTGLPNRAKVVVGISSGLLFLSLFGMYFSPAGEKLRGRTRWYVEDPLGGARLLLWRDSLGIAATNWLTGIGAETFTARFPRYQSVELASAYPDFYHESPHNIFLDVATSQGALGLLSFAAAVVMSTLAAWRSRKHPAALAIGSAFVAALVSLQFNTFVLTTAFFFWLAIALLLTWDTPIAEAEPIPRWFRWSGFAVGATMALLSLTYAVRLTVSDIALARVRDHFAAGRVEQAISRYSTVRAWQPPGVNSDLYYSRMLSDSARRQRSLMKALAVWQETVQSALRASKESEDPQNAYFHLSALYASLNDSIDAERSLQSAIEIAPRWYKPHWMLAQIFRAEGRAAEARQQAKLSAALAGGKHAEVVETLRQIGW